MIDPTYSLRVEMDGRGGHVHINEVPVFRNYDNDAGQLDVPITHFVNEGDNTIGWLLFEEEDLIASGHHATATMTVRDRAEPEIKPKVLGVVALTGPIGEDTPEQLLSLQGDGPPARFSFDSERGLISVDLTVAVIEEMPPWRWTKSDVIEETPETVASLRQFYSDLRGLLQRGDTDRLIELHSEKAQEFAKAFAMTTEEAMREIELPFKPRDKNSKLLLDPLEEAQFELAAQGRLVRLVFPGDAAVIAYEDANGAFDSFDFWVRRTQDGWMIAR